MPNVNFILVRRVFYILDTAVACLDGVCVGGGDWKALSSGVTISHRSLENIFHNRES